jgi:lactaldehyde dehydrogenase
VFKVAERDSLDVRNPFDNKLIKSIRYDDRSKVLESISRVDDYNFKLSSWERYEILIGLCSLLESHRDELIQLISTESGKTLHDAKIELTRASQAFLLSAEEAKRINGEILPLDAVAGLEAGVAMVMREPIGIVAAITPFNYTLNLVAHKVGPALAANNPVILKPSESTPLTALRLQDLLYESGLPKELLQVVNGNPSEIVQILCADSRVKKISFTGSVEIGKRISQMAGMKHLCMELGGNDPMVILADANLDQALPAAIEGAYGNNGERCTSIKRFIIEEAVADEFIDRFVWETNQLCVGNQLDPTVNVGPLINRAAAVRVERRINAAIEAGAVLRCGGKRQGALLWPTVLDRVGNNNPIVTKETFGPVAPFIRVDSFDQAIDTVNDSLFGLQSGVFTNDLAKAKEAVHRIQAGAVMINRSPGFRAEHLPFGGVKDSGIGREGIKYAVDAMTQIKTVVM